MVRNPGQGPLLADILADLREHDRLLERLDTDDLTGVNGPDDPAEQVYPGQPEGDHDHPVGLWVKLTAGGGEQRNASTTFGFVVDIGLTTRSRWRKAVQQDRQVLANVEMGWLLDLADERASVAWGIPYIEASRAGGAEGLAPESGDQLTSVRRWSVTRRVVGDDGPRA
jgi:hypothetical protein